MQKAKCTVRIAGSMLHTVKKKDVTPGQLVVLRAVHGNDAVVDLELQREGFATKDKFLEQEREFERLCNEYGEEQVRACWPGHTPVIPTTFSEINVRFGKGSESVPSPEDLPEPSEEELDELMGVSA